MFLFDHQCKSLPSSPATSVGPFVGCRVPCSWAVHMLAVLLGVMAFKLLYDVEKPRPVRVHGTLAGA